MTGAANTTTDHKEIQEWIEQRGGIPSVVHATHKEKGSGLLRVDFPEDEPDEGLDAIDWDEFFRIFDSKELAFLYQDSTASGEESRFCKFISRN